MAEIDEETVDIPDPERALAPDPVDESIFDPGADNPPLPDNVPLLGEDPAYDPGGMGHQPDIAEEDEDHR